MSVNHTVVALALGEHASEMLAGICSHYRINRLLLLQVIVESVLDAASEDGDVQRELAEAAEYLREHRHVPDCWLGLEGARGEEGPDDSGVNEHDDYDLENEGREADDDAARGERSDNSVAWQIVDAQWRGKRPGSRSLVDAG